VFGLVNGYKEFGKVKCLNFLGNVIFIRCLDRAIDVSSLDKLIVVRCLDKAIVLIVLFKVISVRC
jgi:hypothetical protein